MPDTTQQPDTDLIPAETFEVSDQDEWLTAKQHAANVSGGVKMTIASTIALGLELNRLKGELGYTHGRVSGQNVNLPPWTEAAPEKTGFSYRQLQRFMQTAEAVRKQLGNSRRKDDKAVKALLKDLPRNWNVADYDTLARAVADRYDATNFRELMLETGLIKPPKQGKSTPTTKKEKLPSIAAEACIAAPIRDLARTLGNPAQFHEHLHQLPLDDQEADEAAGEPALTGLRTLSTCLSKALDEINTVLKAKS